jgi:hypothetical protein
MVFPCTLESVRLVGEVDRRPRTDPRSIRLFWRAECGLGKDAGGVWEDSDIEAFDFLDKNKDLEGFFVRHASRSVFVSDGFEHFLKGIDWFMTKKG